MAQKKNQSELGSVISFVNESLLYTIFYIYSPVHNVHITDLLNSFLLKIHNKIFTHFAKKMKIMKKDDIFNL